jgi:hypothetical protein
MFEKNQYHRLILNNHILYYYKSLFRIPWKVKGMARVLNFKYKGAGASFSIDKLDRRKLYGYKRTDVLDKDGNRCTLATLSAEGDLLVPPGGRGVAYLTDEGRWVGTKERIAVDEAGKPLPQVPSSFGRDIELDRTVTIDEYLAHEAKLVYALTSEEDASEFIKKIPEDEIPVFEFNYRAGPDPDPAFLIVSGDRLYMVVCEETPIEYLALEQAQAVAEVGGEEEEEEEEIDFAMM